MTLRHSVKIKDPETEESKKELAHIEGLKRQGEAEMLETAETKKRLEKEMEDLKARAQSDLETIEEGHKKRLAVIERSISDSETKREEIKNATQKLSDEFDDLFAKYKPLILDIEKKTNELASLKTSIEKLGKEKTSLEEGNTELETSNNKLTLSKNVLVTQVSELEIMKNGLNDDIEKGTKILKDLNDAIRTSGDKVDKIEGTITKLEDQVVEKSAESDAIITSISNLKKEQQQLQDKKEVDEKEASEKVANLVALEARVDSKIKIFQEYKKKFTVDELARMKISTDI